MTYNPLDKENLAKSVVNAFMARPMTSFPTERFEGAGVYALYYSGTHQPYDLYEPIKVSDLASLKAIPIYIGRSVSQAVNLATAKRSVEELRKRVKNHIELFIAQHIEDVPAKLELKTKDTQSITETGAAYDLEPDQALSSDDSDGNDAGE